MEGWGYTFWTDLQKHPIFKISNIVRENLSDSRLNPYKFQIFSKVVINKGNTTSSILYYRIVGFEYDDHNLQAKIRSSNSKSPLNVGVLVPLHNLLPFNSDTDVKEEVKLFISLSEEPIQYDW